MEEDVNELINRLHGELQNSYYPDERKTIRNRYLDTAYFLYKSSQSPHRKPYLSFGSRRSSIVSTYGNTPIVMRRSFSSEGKLDCTTIEQLAPDKWKGSRNLPATGNEDSDIAEEDEDALDDHDKISVIASNVGKPDAYAFNAVNKELSSKFGSVNINEKEDRTMSGNADVKQVNGFDGMSPDKVSDGGNTVSDASNTANSTHLPKIHKSMTEKDKKSTSPEHKSASVKSSTHRRAPAPPPIRNPKFSPSNEQNSEKSPQDFRSDIPESPRSAGLSFPPLISPDCNVKEDHVIRVAVTSLPQVSPVSNDELDSTPLYIEERHDKANSLANGGSIHNLATSSEVSKSFIVIHPTNDSNSLGLAPLSQTEGKSGHRSPSTMHSPNSSNSSHSVTILNDSILPDDMCSLSPSVEDTGVTLLKFTRSSEDGRTNYMVTRSQIKTVPFSDKLGLDVDCHKELVDTNLSRLCVLM